MDKKLINKANGLFLVLLAAQLLVTGIVSLLAARSINIGTTAGLIINQFFILIPGMIYLLVNNLNPIDFCRYKRIKISSAFMCIVFSLLIIPLIAVINAITMVVTSNTVIDMSGDIISMPWYIMVFIIGLFGPFCEEFIFRGIIFNSLNTSGRVMGSALVSGMFFGLLHLNLNQFGYAFVLGLIFALLNEATGSIWSSFICHAWINTQNTLLMYGLAYLGDIMGTDYLKAAGGEMSKQVILMTGAIYLMIAVVTTALAVLLYIGIAGNEGRRDHIKAVFSKKDEMAGSKSRLMTIWGWVAIAVCFFVIFVLDVIMGIA